MALHFHGSSTDLVTWTTNTLSARFNNKSFLSVHVWIKLLALTGTAATNNVILFVPISGASGGFFFNVDGSASGKIRLSGRSQASDSLVGVSGSTVIEKGIWVPVGGVMDIRNDNVRVYLRGAEDGDGLVSPGWGQTAYVNSSPTAVEAVGSAGGASSANQFTGHIAELAVWAFGTTLSGEGRGLDDVEFRALANGENPQNIQRSALEFYQPFWDRGPNVINLIRGPSVTFAGGVLTSDHPEMVRRRWPKKNVFKAPVAQFAMPSTTPQIFVPQRPLLKKVSY